MSRTLINVILIIIVIAIVIAIDDMSLISARKHNDIVRDDLQTFVGITDKPISNDSQAAERKQRLFNIGAVFILSVILYVCVIVWPFRRIMNQNSHLAELQEEAKNASEAKSRFLAIMSHEMRTPLNVIVGLTNLMVYENNSLKDIKENLQKINNAGIVLLGIINDILDISKIESGKLGITPVVYDMASILNDTITLNMVRIKGKPITFRLNISDKLPSKIYGDDLRVKQIFNNLLSNAFKYTHKGTVGLSVHCVRGYDVDVWVEITISDTGIGIRPEDLKKIFSEYSQVDTRTNHKIEGTGLGLSITKKLVELMDGTISVESEYGKGSIFYVRIRQGFVTDTPIGSAVAESLRSLRYIDNRSCVVNKFVHADLSYARVLVVDDVQTNLDVAAGLMRKYKMQVDCVTNGREAIERIICMDPVYNAIFMDHMMPEMDGVETTREIRAIGTEYARTVPIIALTANAITGNEQMFLEHDFQAFLPKPIDIIKLDRIVRQWVRDKSREKSTNSNQIKHSFHPEESISKSENNFNSTVLEFSTCGNILEDLRVTQNETETESSLDALSLNDFEIPGVNTISGLSAFVNDFESYLSILQSYANNTPKIIDKLRNVTEKTLPDYAIAMHGLKSASGSIGAERTMKVAESLELMAKSGNLNEVLAQNEVFLEDTENLVSSIKECLKELYAKYPKPQLYAPNRNILAYLRDSCERYDMDGIDKAMEELERAKYDTDGSFVTWLREKINIMDFSEVAARLAEYEEKYK